MGSEAEPGQHWKRRGCFKPDFFQILTNLIGFVNFKDFSIQIHRLMSCKPRSPNMKVWP